MAHVSTPVFPTYSSPSTKNSRKRRREPEREREGQKILSPLIHFEKRPIAAFTPAPGVLLISSARSSVKKAPHRGFRSAHCLCNFTRALARSKSTSRRFVYLPGVCACARDPDTARRLFRLHARDINPERIDAPISRANALMAREYSRESGLDVC